MIPKFTISVIHRALHVSAAYDAYEMKFVHRVIALRDFGKVKAGDFGGFIEAEKNLSHDGRAWVSENAFVYGHAWVGGDAWVGGFAKIYGRARLCGNMRLDGQTHVVDNETFCSYSLGLSLKEATRPANKDRLLRALLTIYKENPGRWSTQIGLFIDELQHQQGVRYPELLSIQKSARKMLSV